MGCIYLSGTPGLQRPKGDVHRDQRDSGGFRIPIPVLINTYFVISFHKFEIDLMSLLV